MRTPATPASPVSPPVVIAAETRMGTVHLTVRDLSRAADFYRRVLGLELVERPGGSVAGCAPGGTPLVELHDAPGAPALNRRAPGLYHLAILLPSRRDLALSLARLARERWPLDGASDHLVSEALYLSDPEGNGIELYRDRPRHEWTRRNGGIEMATLPLDLRDLLGELAPREAGTRGAGAREPGVPAVGPGEAAIPETVPPRTTIGHVHLQVADLGAAEGFYQGVLGFEVMAHLPPTASFLGAGGYHHHIGLNTWHSAGTPPAPPGAAGLRSFEVLLPSSEELGRVRERLAAAAWPVIEADGGLRVRDPSGSTVTLRAA